jgi:hypothetical protein
MPTTKRKPEALSKPSRACRLGRYIAGASRSPNDNIDFQNLAGAFTDAVP